MTSATVRQTFRDVLAQAAEHARAMLPAQVNGRLEKAVALVLRGDVEPHADGTMTVYSATDATRRYVLIGTGCTCADFERGQAPGGWCQHKIAANLLKSVERVLARRGDPEVEMPEGFEPSPDNDPEGDPEPQPSAPVPVPLPEAPASINVRVQVAGREVQWTLRDTDEARLAARLDVLLARYPLPQAPRPVPQTTAPQLSPQQYNAMAMHRPVAGVCPIHQVQMIENQKNGQRWYSHRLPEGGFCKGR